MKARLQRVLPIRRASDSRALLEFLRDFAWRPTFSSKGFTGKCSLGCVALQLRYKAQHPMSDSTERSRPGYVVRGVCDLYTAPTITPVTIISMNPPMLMNTSSFAGNGCVA